MIAKKSSLLTKEAEKGSAEAHAHQNSYKSSNVEISTIYDSIIVDTSYDPFPIITISNPSYESPFINDLETRNSLETIEPENTTTTGQTPQNTMP